MSVGQVTRDFERYQRCLIDKGLASELRAHFCPQLADEAGTCAYLERLQLAVLAVMQQPELVHGRTAELIMPARAEHRRGKRGS